MALAPPKQNQCGKRIAKQLAAHRAVKDKLSSASFSAIATQSPDTTTSNAQHSTWWSVSRLRRAAQRTDAPSSVIAKQSLGGAYRDRTDDPLLAKQVLSQLS